MKSIWNQSFLYFLVLTWSITAISTAQTISPLPLQFNRICAGEFNEFSATFNYSGFPNGTTFLVVLNNSSGTSTDLIETTTIAVTDVSSTRKTIKFAIPSTLIGSETYQIKVKSSVNTVSPPFANASNQTIFPVYYKPFEKNFTINNQSATATICPAGTFQLVIDNVAGSNQISPLIFTTLKYNWYKNGALISSEKGSSLAVTTTGNYFVEIDYGACSNANYTSNTVLISPYSGTKPTIQSSIGNPFCPNQLPLVLSTEKANAYQWYKDNNPISGAIHSTLSVNQEGNYAVVVNYGGCEEKAVLTLNALKLTNQLDIPDSIILLKGDSKKVNVITNAVLPTYQWYRNDILIPNAINSVYEVGDEGAYKVAINQTSGCSLSSELSFRVQFGGDPNSLVIPNLISPNGDGINDTWVIPQEYSFKDDVEVLLLNANGEQILKTFNYKNDWPNSNYKVSFPVLYYIITTPEKTQKGSLTLLQ